MKIQIDDIVRDMTPEEIAEYEEWQRTKPSPSDIEEQADKAEAYDILMGEDGDAE